MNKLNIRTFPQNPTLRGLSRMERDIVFSTETGVELKLQLILPEVVETTPLFPLVVFVQGSAWTFPVAEHKLPQMGMFAQADIAVAMVTHRSCLDGYPAPAFLQDVKTAIRFLRANAARWHLDPERVGIWGTSSGGNTALLCGLTGDDPSYETAEYAGFSDSVKAVADCFGPTDLPGMISVTKDNADMQQIMRALLGTEPEEQLRRAREISPLYRVEPGKDYPPFFLLHGDADQLVPYDQSVRMGERLLECGAQVSMIRVADAPHENSFWNPAVYDEILRFFKQVL